MELTVQTINFSLPREAEEKIKRRVMTTFKRMRDRTQRIVVRLLDVNGPRGGKDKQCKVIVYSDGLEPIIISDTQETVREAADAALSRASLNLQRKLKKRQSILQQRLRKPTDLGSIDNDDSNVLEEAGYAVNHFEEYAENSQLGSIDSATDRLI